MYLAGFADGFVIFATTLSVSPHKNSLTINMIGNQVADKYDIPFLAESFKLIYLPFGGKS